MNNPTDEVMSVGYTVSDGGTPCLVFCSEFQVPITNKSFCAAYVKYYENDMKFKLGHLSCNTLSLSWHMENKGILAVTHKKEFMGLVLDFDLYNNLVPCLNHLVELKTSYGNDKEV